MMHTVWLEILGKIPHAKTFFFFILLAYLNFWPRNSIFVLSSLLHPAEISFGVAFRAHKMKRLFSMPY